MPRTKDPKHEGRLKILKRLLNAELAKAKEQGTVWSSESLAEALGNVTPPAIAAWRQGRRAPKPPTIRKLGEIFYPNDIAACEEFVTAMMQAREGEALPTQPETGAKRFLTYRPDNNGDAIVQFAGFERVQIEEVNDTVTIRFRRQ
ncbi:MAG: hypothetical protein JWN50_733 [Parcubacteria group bacterium]|nr:hypothetical protein [Parcubacteria group bacterium]